MRFEVAHQAGSSRIRLIDADGELVAEVAEDDPLYPQLEHLATRFAEAVAGSPVTVYRRGDSRMSWLTDPGPAEEIFREAVQLVYRDRCSDAAPGPIGLPFHDEHNPTLPELVELEARCDPELVEPFPYDRDF